ncbi:hypothetical protein JRQ81_007983 [Phrynocephalus forsythii]|uniref:Small ribosomal subunit protein uS7 domain-containing protein n=1 Tax=Phrynocephalus forsythii TaxID=171643 RepID=A0A9Q0XEK3_9SAUR|nr:hypothetical protein JRQ81_007983 [Phrynocephalus forsythii]
MATRHEGCARCGTQPNTSRHELTTAMHHLCPRSRGHSSLSRRFTACQALERKKSLAYGIIHSAIRNVEQEMNNNPLSIPRQAIRRVTPDVTVKARRPSGSTYQVPTEMGSARGKALAIRRSLWASRKRPGRDMAPKPSIESMDAARDGGNATRRKEETRRIAEANRAFANPRLYQ